MLDFEKLNRLFEVQCDEDKACMFAYVWRKSKESTELESSRNIKLSDAYKKVQEKEWHFYPGDENSLMTYLVTGLLNKELGAFETNTVTLFLFNLGRKVPLEDVDTTNGINDTSLIEINQTRHDVNLMLGLWTQDDLVQGIDYRTEEDLSGVLKALRLWKETALNLLYKEFPSKFKEMKDALLKLL